LQVVVQVLVVETQVITVAVVVRVVLEPTQDYL
jgi:hypothetical protein